MTSFSFNYDRSWGQFPYGTLLNTHRNPSKSREITADMDDKTISEIFVDSLMEIVKKSFETTSKSYKSYEVKASETPINLDVK